MTDRTPTRAEREDYESGFATAEEAQAYHDRKYHMGSGGLVPVQGRDPRWPDRWHLGFDQERPAEGEEKMHEYSDRPICESCHQLMTGVQPEPSAERDTYFCESKECRVEPSTTAPELLEEGA